jgi:hypothetical protein
MMELLFSWEWGRYFREIAGGKAAKQRYGGRHWANLPMPNGAIGRLV